MSKCLIEISSCVFLVMCNLVNVYRWLCVWDIFDSDFGFFFLLQIMNIFLFSLIWISTCWKLLPAKIYFYMGYRNFWQAVSQLCLILYIILFFKYYVLILQSNASDKRNVCFLFTNGIVFCRRIARGNSFALFFY